MASKPDWPSSDPQLAAVIAVAIAEELHRLADEATERARAACERANTMPLFDSLKNKGTG